MPPKHSHMSLDGEVVRKSVEMFINFDNEQSRRAWKPTESYADAFIDVTPA